jgi:hypothetical protein
MISRSGPSPAPPSRRFMDGTGAKPHLLEMRSYCTSKKWASYAAWWQSLRAAGVPIVASWIDWLSNHDVGTEPTSDAWSRHWTRCIDETAEADILLFYADQDERQCGALVELGAALAAGKRVFVVSPYR